jgi:hypothetical protein
MAPHRGRVSNFGDLPAAGDHCGFPTGSDAYCFVISGYAVNAGRTWAMLINAGRLPGAIFEVAASLFSLASYAQVHTEGRRITIS